MKLLQIILIQAAAIIAAATIGAQAAPTSPTGDLQRNPEQHLYRDGRHLVSKDTGKTWSFLGCEADPVQQEKERKEGGGIGVPETTERDESGNIRTSCDGGVTWE
ncbi:hypothetical protein THASP1DRAFT_31914 [Thamnocephalis sphaerospora]|uniref:Sortilin N-terminal domain-containing protein n=1 Tax=Thamnocephalis sphaerospora TaxID=78915 RepID=A0A4P9XKD6_9FUNG|nr:hypothetical protein THASP1DRAFT_31914 [Thamnocephalis sphaerospora]|eukprot:RKP06264.1 hypothetical protein THASP1DRAFT_31914 [Thamnocephalis sphaerospora]